jgi:hypothetical protein
MSGLDAAEIRACWEARGGWVDFTRSELEELLALIHTAAGAAPTTPASTPKPLSPAKGMETCDE